ncbi:hypothetical protein [Streptoalloteichus hindustanus]|uniref:Uncharacterized protein n=1 Tax=Streptoalloteichus hindustanus TaxID=2017 RepID=A0A1M5QFH7_STRHI|nr:hypothetical protein [Streptoalloteichus hindustanus]SHH12817.1 hypothetical protein SAMN05444320_12410 [Streptoalloteichus hindustanus]
MSWVEDFLVSDTACDTQARSALHALRIHREALRALVEAGAPVGRLECLESVQEWDLALDQVLNAEALWADLVEVVTARWLAWRALLRAVEADHQRWLLAQHPDSEPAKTRPVLRLVPTGDTGGDNNGNRSGENNGSGKE